MIINAVAVLVLTMMMSACDGIFNGIYDDPQGDDDIKPGFNGRPEDTRYLLVLDARSYNSWVYVDLHGKKLETHMMPDTIRVPQQWDGKSQWTYYAVNGSVYEEHRHLPTMAQEDAQQWDFAVHVFDVKTNGGAALETDCYSIDEAPETSAAFEGATFSKDEWTKHQCIVDLSGMLSYDVWYMSSYANLVLSNWVTMDFSTPPPVYSATKKVYVLRMKDGTYAALQLLDYMSDTGTKGFLTIDVKYPY